MATEDGVNDPESAVRAVGGPAELDVNAVLTASGHLSLEGTVLHFRPGRDARLLGRKPLQVALAEVTGIQRRDGTQRVVISAGDQEHVFRGVGAQRVWLALTAARDVTASGLDFAAHVFEEENVQGDAASSKANGLFGIGARGYGYASRPAWGRPVSYWDPLESLASIHRYETGVVVRGAEDRTITTACAQTFAEALTERWLEAAPDVEPRDRWRVRAGRLGESQIEFGVLALSPDGLAFTPVGAEADVLVHRGGLAIVKAAAEPASILEVGTDDGTHRFRLVGAATNAETLAAVFGSDDWRARSGQVARTVLAPEQVSRIYGPCASVVMHHGDAVVGRARRLLLRPTASQVELVMAAGEADPPPVPFPCRLSIAGVRGRFAVPGAVVRLQALAGDARERGWFNAVVRFRGDVVEINEREHYRLPVDLPAMAIELVGGNSRRRYTEFVRVVDVSVRGCRVSVPAAPDTGSVLGVDVDLRGSPLTLGARVVHVTATKEGLFVVGAAWVEASADRGARYFKECQTEQLRTRQR